MICRIVLYRLKPGTSSEDEHRLVEEARKQLPRIPGVMNLRAGRCLDPASSSYSVALIMDFADQAAFESYFVHPDHRRFVQEVAAPLVADIFRLNFEG